MVVKFQFFLVCVFWITDGEIKKKMTLCHCAICDQFQSVYIAMYIKGEYCESTGAI